MTTDREIRSLAARMEERGAQVTIATDREGYIDSVQISGAAKIGPHPMGPLGAAERMREWLHRHAR